MAEDRVGDVGLRHPRERLLAAPAVEQQHLVLLGVEADAPLAHVVDDEQVDPLALELLAGVGHDVVGLGGEADDERTGAACRDLGQDVGVRREVEREVALALELDGRRLARAVVGDGRRLDHERGVGEVLEHRLAHLLGRLDGDEDGARRRREGGRPGDQLDRGAAGEVREPPQELLSSGHQSSRSPSPSHPTRSTDLAWTPGSWGRGRGGGRRSSNNRTLPAYDSKP